MDEIKVLESNNKGFSSDDEILLCIFHIFRDYFSFFFLKEKEGRLTEIPLEKCAHACQV